MACTHSALHKAAALQCGLFGSERMVLTAVTTGGRYRTARRGRREWLFVHLFEQDRASQTHTLLKQSAPPMFAGLPDTKQSIGCAALDSPPAYIRNRYFGVQCWRARRCGDDNSGAPSSCCDSRHSANLPWSSPHENWERNQNMCRWSQRTRASLWWKHQRCAPEAASPHCTGNL